ncbi:unnamed protein product [Rotaria sp. Silwood1]|nr:unnamed protein product [Rotaria sp. Silwood1]CAF4837649.1 unnamed protein product [Rotaria sp. Silwood1]CAF4891623.1 unnamed protein product [Rotaria sp. Silwood1]
MHASKLASEGIRYLGSLQLHELCQLQEELDTLWNNGKTIVSNNLYDKVVDGINYEIAQLTNDPYNFVMTKTDSEVKDLVDYFTQLPAQGQSRIGNSMLGILQKELALRNDTIVDPTIQFPSHWTNVSPTDSSVQLIPLVRSSQEFQEISNYFIKSLGRPSTVIYSIIRIQNIRLWNIYQQVQRTIQCTSTRLIHGTASLSQQKLITFHGFYWSYCPNGLIGDGIYFALNASYSNNDPYVMKKTPHRRELFICQVLLGQTTLGKNGLQSPPQGFHAVHFSNTHQIDEFCIFNHYQAYPEYIVQYDYE